MIVFTVYGKPEPAGSKKGFPFRRKNGSMGVAISDANAKAKPWQAAVAAVAAEAYQGPLLAGPLAVTFRFIVPRIKGHYGTGRNSAVIKPDSPAWPTVKPDVLKLSRAVEDALTGIIYRDDSQIVHETLQKEYGEPARVIVTIAEMQSLAAN